MKPEHMQQVLAENGIPRKIVSRGFTIISDLVRQNAINAIKELPLDGSCKVTISGSATKSARQRGLQWTWYRDVIRSGKGGRHEENDTEIDLFSKWQFARPILIREDPFFAEIYTYFMKNHGDNKDHMRIFTRDWIHTERLTVAQMAQFLTEFQRYYTDKGIELSEPEDRRLLAR